jgi:hypothetical protein
MDFDAIDSAVQRGKSKKGISIESDEDLIRMARDWRRYAGIEDR